VATAPESIIIPVFWTGPARLANLPFKPALPAREGCATARETSAHDAAVRQAVDELAAKIVWPWRPTQTVPGSLERVAVYRARELANEFRPRGRKRSLHVRGDLSDAPDQGILSFRTLNGLSGDRVSSAAGYCGLRRGGGRDSAPPELLLAVDLKAVAHIGADWGRAHARPQEEDAHVYHAPTVRAELVS
jgi:hypothetical protein